MGLGICKFYIGTVNSGKKHDANARKRFMSKVRTLKRFIFKLKNIFQAHGGGILKFSWELSSFMV